MPNSKGLAISKKASLSTRPYVNKGEIADLPPYAPYCHLMKQELDKNWIEAFDSVMFGMRFEFAKVEPRAWMVGMKLTCYELIKKDEEQFSWRKRGRLVREFAQSKLGSEPTVFMSDVNCWTDAFEIVEILLKEEYISDYVIVWPGGDHRTAYMAFSLSPKGIDKATQYWSPEKEQKLSEDSPMITNSSFYVGPDKPTAEDLRAELRLLYPLTKFVQYSDFRCTVRQISKHLGSHGYGEGHHIDIKEVFAYL